MTVYARPPWCGIRWSTSQDGTGITTLRMSATKPTGNSAFTIPWGYQSGAMFNNLVVFQQYCQKYGKSHDGLAPPLSELAQKRPYDTLGFLRTARALSAYARGLPEWARDRGTTGDL